MTEEQALESYAMNVPNLRRRSQAVYLACEEPVAKDISAALLWAAREIEWLRKALEEIARQKLSAEIEAEEPDSEASPDYEFGYDEIIRTARDALPDVVGGSKDA